MNNKKLILVSFTLSTLISCNVNNHQLETNFSIQSSNDKIISKESVKPTNTNIPMNLASGNLEKIKIDKVPDKKFRFDFDIAPDESVPIIGNSISVIFKNDFKIRVKNKTNLISKSSKDITRLQKVLLNYGLVEASDSTNNLTEQDLEDQDKKNKNFYGNDVEIPNMGSLHTYIFQDGANVKEISKELRKLDFVVNAYPSIKIVEGGIGTPIGTKQTPSNYIYSPLPNDSEFSSKSENDLWWFNRHKVHQAQSLYGSTTVPKIAVLDDGFDTQSFAIDKPNYLSGYSITCTPTCTVLSGDLLEPSINNSTTSHGTEVASIIGSPKNNNQGLMGILPNANILPIRLSAYSGNSNAPSSYAVQEVVAGINKAVQESSDVISLSLQTANLIPITYDSVIRSAVANAISSGTIVACIAGNDSYNEIKETPPSDPNNGKFYIPDVGEIIVGGSMNDTVTGKSSAYNISGVLGNGSGSSYGSRVDLVAGAHGIYTQTYEAAYPNDPSKRKLIKVEGTSFSCPMVATAAGMVKKIASANGLNLNPTNVRKMLIYSSNMSRYSKGYSTSPETKFLGKDLYNSYFNVSLAVGMRELNIYNALLIAKNLAQTNSITRVSNTDDVTWSTINNNWTGRYGDDSNGYDSIYQLSGMVSGQTIDFKNYNFSLGYTYSYQLFKLNAPFIDVFERFSGVQGIVGANNNDQSITNNWTNSYSITY